MQTLKYSEMLAKSSLRFFHTIYKKEEIGKVMLKMAKSELIWRYDHNTIEDQKESGGFAQRYSKEKFATISKEILDCYQDEGLPRIGTGGCNDFTAATKFLHKQQPYVQSDLWLYVFLAKETVDLCKVHELYNSFPQYNYEKEFLVISTVDFSNILFCCNPKDRLSLESGALVPNRMAEYNSILPEVFSKKDVENKKAIISCLARIVDTKDIKQIEFFSSLVNQLFSKASLQEIEAIGFDKEVKDLVAQLVFDKDDNTFKNNRII